jgi:hypothetical protein
MWKTLLAIKSEDKLVSKSVVLQQGREIVRKERSMGELDTEEGSALELLKFSDVLDYLGEICEWMVGQFSRI